MTYAVQARVRRMLMGLVFVFAALLAGGAVHGQSAPANAAPPDATVPATAPAATPNAPRSPQAMSDQARREHSFTTDREQFLSIVILCFGTLVLIVQYLLLRTPRRSSFEILQLLGINLIVTGTLFLISAGYDAQSIAPGLGLFGTIAGYVLGRRSSPEPGPAANGTGEAS